MAQKALSSGSEHQRDEQTDVGKRDLRVQIRVVVMVVASATLCRQSTSDT